MAMKRPKSSNGARWKKGHSCVSNSLNTRHRDAAKGRFFQKIEGDSALTVDALAKHAATLTVGNDVKILTANAEDDESIGRSFNTFATNFTSCTIPAFEKFFLNFKMDSDLHKRMLAVYAAAQEYLKSNDLPETSTSYLCAFIVSLEGVKEIEEDVAATLSLISRVIRKVSPKVLQDKYGEIEKLFHDIFTVFADSDNKDILTNVIGCLSVLLRMQDRSIWEHSFTMNILKKILVYVTCENAKVRKCAQYSVSAILKGSSFTCIENSNNSEDEEMDEDLEGNDQVEYVLKTYFKRKPVIIHPSAKDVGEFILYNLKLATNSNNGKLTLHLLLFLQQVICHLPKDTLKKCCSTILGIMHIGDSVVNSRSLKVLQVLFSSEVITTLEKDVNEALINALVHSSDIKKSSLTRTLKLIPNMNESHLCSCWMATVSCGIVHLMRLDESSGIVFLGPFTELLTTFWKSDHSLVHEQVFFTIEYLLDECVVPLGEKFASLYSNEALRSFEAVELALSLQFQSAWPFVFRSLAVFYRVMGRLYSREMMKCLKNLSELSSDVNSPHRNSIENVIGSAVKSIGPELVLQAVPLQITGDVLTDERHFWILPLLSRFVKGARLCFFVSHFIPLANKCAAILKTLNMKLTANTEDRTLPLLISTYETIEKQIWFLFKSFANEATDVKEAMSKEGGAFAKLIFDCIRLREDIRVDILKGLRNIINASKNEPEEIIKYSKNYIPALFNLYLKKPHDKEAKVIIDSSVDSGHRLAVYETIQKYLEVLPVSEIVRVFNLVMNRYDNEASSSPFTHKALLNLARAFIQYLDLVSLKEFVSKVSHCVLNKDSKGQKTVYRIIEDILSLQNESIFKDHVEEIMNLLSKSQSFVARNAWASRLKCYYHILAHLQAHVMEIDQAKIIEKIITEVISCCGTQNSLLCRKNAYSLLLEIGSTMQNAQQLSCEETFSYYFELLPNFDPESPSTANSIQALRFLAYKFQDSLPSDRMIKKTLEVSNFLPNASRDIVKASLAFIRLMFVVNPPVLMSEIVGSIMKSVLKMPRERRKIFRTQLRDLLACFVRKYGADRMRALVPEKDELRKLLVGVIKTENRKKRTRKVNDRDESEKEEKSVPLSLDEILSAIDKEIEDDSPKSDEKKQIPKAGKKSKKQTWIVEEEDDIVDFLDLSACKNIKTKEPINKHLRFELELETKTDEEKYGFRLDRKTNKFIITDKEPEDNSDKEDDDYFALEGLSEMANENKLPPNGKQTTKRKRTVSQNSNGPEEDNSKKDLKITSKRNKFDYGAEFRSKKAGGDKMRKLGVAPYAYVQFSREKLNRRNKSKFSGQYKDLVKGGKNGGKGKMKKRTLN